MAFSDFFSWFNQPCSQAIHLRFTRLVFGLRLSPAILGAVISQHLMKYKGSLPELVHKIENSLYLDNLVSRANSLANAIQFYEESKRIME